MTALREFTKVKNHVLSIQLPESFDYEDVEVIIIPRVDTDDLSHLNDEIEKCMNSSISPKTHEEIFAELKSKYAN